MKLKDMRRRDTNQLEADLAKFRKELMETRATLAAGGSIDNPAKIKLLKRDIARIMTILKEQQA